MIVFPIIATLFSLLHSDAAFQLIAATITNQNVENGLLGWTPRPTSPPVPLPFRKRQNGGLHSDCGYDNGTAQTCGPNSYCAFAASAPFFNCCGVDNSGAYNSACVIATACINSQEISTSCGAADYLSCGSSSWVWYVHPLFSLLQYIQSLICIAMTPLPSSAPQPSFMARITM